jgi:hypothetical protein
MARVVLVALLASSGSKLGVERDRKGNGWG